MSELLYIKKNFTRSMDRFKGTKDSWETLVNSGPYRVIYSGESKVILDVSRVLSSATVWTVCRSDCALSKNKIYNAR